MGSSKLNLAVAIGPEANSSNAEICVSTVTSKVSPARGPLPIVRLFWARRPKPETVFTGPKSWTSAVR